MHASPGALALTVILWSAMAFSPFAGAALAAGAAPAPSASLGRKAPEAASLLAAAGPRGTVRVIITLAMPGGSTSDDAVLAARVKAVVTPFVADHFGQAARSDVTAMPFIPMVAAPVTAEQLQKIAADRRVLRIDADGIARPNASP